MNRWRPVVLAALGVVLVLAACGGGGSASAAPTATATTDGSAARHVTIRQSGGPELTFDVASCDSPGSNVVNLQADGPAGHLDLRASVTGRFDIAGLTAVHGEIEQIEIADDGSITASGTVATGDAAAVPFELAGPAGTCP